MKKFEKNDHIIILGDTIEAHVSNEMMVDAVKRIGI